MGGDLPPAVLPSFMLGWGSSQARGVLPKGKGKLGIRKFLELARPETYRLPRKNARYILASEGFWRCDKFRIRAVSEPTPQPV
jgi:hypothetical protein